MWAKGDVTTAFAQLSTTQSASDGIMWLADVDSVWDDPLPVDGLRETELALRLLERSRELLGDGEYWRAEALAMTADSEPCDPLSDKAHYFSVGGAAARARWEMREELADAEISPANVRQVMNALFSVAREYRGEVGGWTFAEAVLDGMKSALEEYRGEQVAEVGMSRRDAA
jgi:hypothetical protein